MLDTKINIETYRMAHKALKLFGTRSNNAGDRRFCEFLQADLEQAIHSKVPFTRFLECNMYCHVLHANHDDIHRLGETLDQGESPFFLTYHSQSALRFLAKILPLLGVCQQNWKVHRLNLPYWKEIFDVNRTTLCVQDSGYEYCSPLFTLLEVFRAHQMATWRVGKCLSRDMEEYLCGEIFSTPQSRLFFHELSELLLHPENIVLQAVSSPIMWIRTVGMAYLGRVQPISLPEP